MSLMDILGQTRKREQHGVEPPAHGGGSKAPESAPAGTDAKREAFAKAERTRSFNGVSVWTIQ